MKKAILSLLAFFGMTMTVTAQSVTVADIEAIPGQEAMATLVLTCPENKFSGLNFSIQFPATGFSVDKDNALAGWEGSKAVGEMKDGKVKFSIASTYSFAATTEVHVYFTLGDVDLKDYELTVTDLKFDNEGTLIPAPDVPFKVKVSNCLTLSEDATVAPKAVNGVNVMVKRTIAANTWSTICLPFAMSEAQVKDAFGDKVVLGDFDDYNLAEEGKDIVGITVKFKSVTAIEANHPYIIKASKAVTEFNVENVNVAPSENLEINLGSSRKPHSIIGNYIAESKIENGGLFLKGGKFYYSLGDTKIKGFRAYFNFDDLLTEFENEYATSRINITFDDVTAIKGIKTDGEEEIYTLSGQRVNKAGKGVYIVNGKKVIKK